MRKCLVIVFTFLYFMFHVEHFYNIFRNNQNNYCFTWNVKVYLPRCTNKTEISAGLIPEIRLA